MKRFTLSHVMILMLNLCMTLSLLRVSDPQIGEKLRNLFEPEETYIVVGDGLSCGPDSYTMNSGTVEMLPITNDEKSLAEDIVALGFVWDASQQKWMIVE